MKMSLSFRALAIAAALLAGTSARADLILKLDVPINGVAPQGYLLATFADAGTDTVKLTLDATNLVASEYVAGIGFNIDPNYLSSFSGPTVARTGGTAPAGAVTGTQVGENVSNVGNQVKAGLFDLVFSFASANADRFKFNTTLEFTITGAAGSGLNANSFNFPSSPDGNDPGGWLAAADIRAIGTAGGSGSFGTKMAIPEPTSLVMSGIGLFLGLGVTLRRRFAR